MSLPLPNSVIKSRPSRESDGHVGLWYDKFCDQWRVTDSTCAMKDGNSKLAWINKLTSGTVGMQTQIRESTSRLVALVDSRGGRWGVFTTASRFVTGLGLSHPVENGFAWHPTLGTPYLPGSSIKGIVRAWAERDADPHPDGETIKCLLGDRGTVGNVCFLDAIPIEPVPLEADVITPHYARWSQKEPPGDWRSPIPIPYLVTAAEAPFLFGIVPRCRAVSDESLHTVMGWMCSALTWAGGGAKTAVGYGRFERNDGKTSEMRRAAARPGARAGSTQDARGT